ncbi:MAG TPA: hypothetical protein V6C64_07130, partial [Microcoleaceae cyanobacterium]
MLVSCSNQPQTNLPVQSTEASPTEAPAVEAQSTPSTKTGHGLSPAQVAKLTKLPIQIVAPTALPPGFRVVSADGDNVKLANGDDDAGYSISYQGDDGTCFVINSSQDGPRRLKQIGQVESAVGTIKMYEEIYEGRRSVQSFIPVKGNPVMLSPVLQFKPDNGTHEACKALDLAEYERILQSIE